MKKRYVLIGSSGRALYMFAKPMAERFSDHSEIVGIFDPNPLRSEAVKRIAGLSCDVYTDCDRMLAEQEPDRALITTIDCTHEAFIVKSLEAGAEAVAEKPMAISAGQCRSILEAEKRTGKRVIVTFNLRYTPFLSAIKEAIAVGSIGRVLSINIEYLLDTLHGADYFRRWHRKKKNSGGLMVHKSTHHFDLANWFIEEDPVDVMAYGTRRFYGSNSEKHGERCLTCQMKGTCNFYFDIEAQDSVGGIDGLNRTLYRECEESDGYFRDRCVFADDIDIEDTMSVNVRYSGGALLNYSLIAHSPYEGHRIAINGTQGRLEAEEYSNGPKSGGSYSCFRVYGRDGGEVVHRIPKDPGDHAGGDERLRRALLIGDVADTLNRQAGAHDAALSVMVGVAANQSIEERRNIAVRDLLLHNDVRLDDQHSAYISEADIQLGLQTVE